MFKNKIKEGLMNLLQSHISESVFVLRNTRMIITAKQEIKIWIVHREVVNIF